MLCDPSGGRISSGKVNLKAFFFPFSFPNEFLLEVSLLSLFVALIFEGFETGTLQINLTVGECHNDFRSLCRLYHFPSFQRGRRQGKVRGAMVRGWSQGHKRGKWDRKISGEEWGGEGAGGRSGESEREGWKRDMARGQGRTGEERRVCH